MYTCPCEVGCKNAKPLTTNCVSISASLSERISLFNCKKSCPLLTSKLLIVRFQPTVEVIDSEIWIIASSSSEMSQNCLLLSWHSWCCRFDADVSAARDCTDPIVSCTTVPLSWVPREETDQRMCGRPVEHNEQMRRRSMLLLCEGKHEKVIAGKHL